MRTTILGLVAALIAAIVLVAVPGPAGSTPPSTRSTPDPAAFSRLALPLESGPASTASTTLDPALDAAAVVAPESVFGEPLPVPAVPSRRARVIQPAAPVRTIVKPRRRSRPVPITAASGGGWRWDPEASWYGPGFYGNRTACGQAYTRQILGVAHRTLPCGTRITFRNPKNGRTLTVPVIDRGPYVAGRRWDLSGGLCVALDHCYTGPIQWRFAG